MVNYIDILFSVQFVSHVNQQCTDSFQGKHSKCIVGADMSLLTCHADINCSVATCPWRCHLTCHDYVTPDMSCVNGHVTLHVHSDDT